MKKNLSKNQKDAIMESVMKELGKKVHGILENFDSNKQHRRPVNEMARAAVNRAVDPKALANVRDTVQRHKYDRDWAKSAKPIPRLLDDDYQLLHRYVAALLLFGEPCPQTEEDIDKIGIFANYAHALLDNSGTLEDIQLLYSKNDKIVPRERKGSKRAIKGWRDENRVSSDFDFDAETPAETPAEEPVEKPYPSYDEVDADDEVSSEDIPPYDEVEIDDVENQTAPEEEAELEADEDADADGQIDMEWDNLADITREEYYNPAYNRSFSNINDDFIFWDEKNNLIGMEMSIEDRDNGDSRQFKIWAPSFGKLLEHFDIAVDSAVQNMSDKFYKVKTLPVNMRFWKAWRKTITTDEIEDEIDDSIDDFYFNHLGTANDIDEVVKEIQEMKY